MKKKIAIAVLAVLVLGAWVFRGHFRPTPPAPDVRTQAIETVTRYLAAAKAHDLTTIKSLSYQISPECSDPAKVDACYKKMDTLVSAASTTDFSTFTHAVYDAKQIILTTEYVATSTDIVKGRTRSILYFTRTSSGDPQVLAFMPGLTTFTTRQPKDSDTEARLNFITTDTDQDTIDDEVETCTYVGVDPKTCVKTDPNKIVHRL